MAWLLLSSICLGIGILTLIIAVYREETKGNRK